MKLKSHIIIFLSLFIINLFVCGAVVFDKSSGSNYSYKRVVPDKVKFKSAQKEEALVIKTNKASGTTKLEINMIDYNKQLVSLELKSKVDPKNPRKVKYKYKDEDDEKSTFCAVKYPEIKEQDKSQTDDKDSFKVLLERNGKEILVCKIKFSPGKMKIGSDEECATATYEIKNQTERKKKKTVEKLKVYKKDIYIASVSKSKESGKYKVKKVKEGEEDKEDLYSTKDLNYMSYSIGVLALENMDPRLRAVIAAEILKKEK